MYSLSARNSEDSYIGDLDNEKPLEENLKAFFVYELST